MFGKNKKKKGILGLKGQAYLDAYNQKMNDTGKTTLAEKARFFKETQKLRRIAEKEAGN
jgi:hypothetical protein|tara:strand:- start:3505 stop:3681 length:177 start_codon:yes stop_codon:yes gene_type:complete